MNNNGFIRPKQASDNDTKNTAPYRKHKKTSRRIKKILHILIRYVPYRYKKNNVFCDEITIAAEFSCSFFQKKDGITIVVCPFRISRQKPAPAAGIKQAFSGASRTVPLFFLRAFFRRKMRWEPAACFMDIRRVTAAEQRGRKGGNTVLRLASPSLAPLGICCIVPASVLYEGEYAREPLF